MKRPMMVFAVAWLAGLFLADTQLNVKGSNILICYSIFLLCSFFYLKKYPYSLEQQIQPKWYPKLTLALLVIPCLLCGGQFRMEQELKKQQEEKAGWITQENSGEAYVFVQGKVTEKRCKEQTVLVLSDCLIQGYQEKGTHSVGDCQVVVKEEGKAWLPKTFIGNEILVYGTYSLYEPAGNPGQFDAAAYYNEKGLYASVKAVRITILSEKQTWLGHKMYCLKEQLRQSLVLLYPVEKAGVLTAMILGDKDLLEEEVKTLYQQNGISHILAISGLHISMLCMGLFRFLRRLGVPLKIAVGAAVLFLVFYICFSGASTSSLRAGVMCLVMFGAKIVRRSYDLLSSLSFAAIIVTAIRPMELTSAGFLLSFSAVLGVALAQELERVLLEQKKKTEEQIEADSTKEGIKKVGKNRRKEGNWWNAILFGGIIQCLTIPVSLWFYYELSPYSIILNLLVIPLVSLIFGGGLLSMLLGNLCPNNLLWIAELPAGGTYLLLEFYEWLGTMTQKLPWSYALIGRPKGWQMVSYYVILVSTLWVVLHWKIVYEYLQHRLKHRRDGAYWRWCFKKKCGLVLMTGITIAMGVLVLPKSNESKILFLDVSQGDGALIYTKEGTVILSDCGSSDVSSVGTYRLSPVLKQEGIALIDLAIVSHTDSDHISGIKELLEEMPVYRGRNHYIQNYNGAIGIVELILPKVSKPSDAYLELEALAHEKNVRLRYVQAGEVLYQEEGLLMECLSPEEAKESSNDTSLVFLLQTNEVAVWFMGDAGTLTEENIMKKLEQINKMETGKGKQTILKVGHHGSKTSSGKAFLSFVSPEVAVISCGAGNSYGHPHSSVVERLEQSGSLVMTTMEYGAIQITMEKEMVVEGYKK